MSNDLGHTLCANRPMPRKLLKKYLPNPAHLREHKHLKMFGARLTDGNLWHLNRHSVAAGACIGLFCALLPIPLQLFPAAVLAILFRANLPLSVALVWITNPLTAVPIWYGAYLLGTEILGKEASWRIKDSSFEAVSRAMWENFGHIYLPMFIGSLLIGIVLGGTAWAAVHYMWRANIRHHWRLRREKRRTKRDTVASPIAQKPADPTDQKPAE